MGSFEEILKLPQYYDANHVKEVVTVIYDMVITDNASPKFREDLGPYEMVMLDDRQRAPATQRFAAAVIDKTFFVRVYLTDDGVRIAGRQKNVGVASAVYRFLNEALKNLWTSERHKRGLQVSEKNYYQYEIAWALKSLLDSKKRQFSAPEEVVNADENDVNNFAAKTFGKKNYKEVMTLPFGLGFKSFDRGTHL